MATRWRAVAQGNYFSGPWLGEIAQIGISGTVGALEPVGAVNVALPEFAAGASGGSGSWSLGTYDQAFDGDLDLAGQTAIATAFHAYLTALNASTNFVRFFVASFRWSEIRISAFEDTGAVVNGASVFTLTGSNRVTGVGTAANQVPPQLSVVQSLRTGGRGSRNNSRWYVPLQTGPVGTSSGLGPLAGGSNGMLRAETPAAMNAAAIDFLDDLTVDLGDMMMARPAVVSARHQTYSDIVAVRVGNLVDTQRRRSNGLAETFTDADWPA